MIDETWIRKEINFTSYNKSALDTIAIRNKSDVHLEFIRYSSDYFTAAEEIINYLETVNQTNDYSTLNTWFFAFTYLLRHSLELSLKATLIKYDVPLSDIITSMRHNLSIGFYMLNQKISSLDKSNPNCIWLQRYLNNISEIDAESDMFRYPFNNKMERFFDGPREYDYIAIYENAERARQILIALNKERLQDYTNKYNHAPCLLIEGGDLSLQAVVEYDFSNQHFYPYIRAYTESANHLLTLINQSTDFKCLFLPMCYLFRNSIELELKRLFILGTYLNNQACGLRKYKHKLLKLWRAALPTIEEYSNTPENDLALAHCEKYIEQLNNWDGCSSTFRYPINKKGEFFFKRERRYNYNNVGQCFNDINLFFICVESKLDYILETKMEMELDYISRYDC